MKKKLDLELLRLRRVASATKFSAATLIKYSARIDAGRLEKRVR